MRRSRSKGFTVVEVMAALTLLALVAAAATTLASASLKATAHNRQATYAVLVAQDELEELRSMSYADVVSRTTTAYSNGVTYTLETAVSTGAPIAGVKRITVTVTWMGIGGERSYVVETVFTSLS